MNYRKFLIVGLAIVALIAASLGLLFSVYPPTDRYTFELTKDEMIPKATAVRKIECPEHTAPEGMAAMNCFQIIGETSETSWNDVYIISYKRTWRPIAEADTRISCPPGATCVGRSPDFVQWPGDASTEARPEHAGAGTATQPYISQSPAFPLYPPRAGYKWVIRKGQWVEEKGKCTRQDLNCAD